MPAQPASLFVPGWGAPPGLYAPGLPPGWTMLEPPLFQAGTFAAHRRWLVERLDALAGAVVLGGHSMGGALAIAAAAARPERVRSLVLVSPAGLPLTKPIRLSLRDLCLQAATRRYPAWAAATVLRAALARPRQAVGLARDVRALDLSEEMARVRAAGILATVLGCTTDTLVTARHSRRAATLLGARYRELPAAGGHMWMLGEWRRFERELVAATPA
jgi:pimeloyl-ACP methyl ester carboxylesterase